MALILCRRYSVLFTKSINCCCIHFTGPSFTAVAWKNQRLVNVKPGERLDCPAKRIIIASTVFAWKNVTSLPETIKLLKRKLLFFWYSESHRSWLFNICCYRYVTRHFRKSLCISGNAWGFYKCLGNSGNWFSSF